MGDGCLAANSSNSSGSSMAGGSGPGRLINHRAMGANAGIRKVINVVDDKMLIFDPPDTHNPIQRMQRAAYGGNTKRVREHRFVFDRLFDNTATQEEVYDNTTRPLLDSVLDGYNATVFAYGATGCGKTHTISGTPSEPGIIFLTMKELFERIEELQDTKHIELSLSYLEIYNETIRDLLDTNTSKSLVLREDADQRISVSNLSTHKPQNVQEVMDMIIQGNQCRTMSPTEANATSSRSHAVLQINVVQKSRTASLSEAHTFATLSIIDLAGSERASATKNRGERLLEGANINKSLLALGNCINALCDPRRRNHVPYRDSKLTRLLKFSLGGNCKTVMIVCVSPSSKHYDETLNTLKYADRAKKIKTKVIRNEHNLNRHVGSYLKMITEQKQEIEELRAREHRVVNIALTNAERGRKKCLDSTAEALENYRQAIVKAGPSREARLRSLIKFRALFSQISQIESIIHNLSLSSFASDSASLAGALNSCLEKLVSERSQIEQHLSSTENNTSDQHQLEVSMHTIIRRLEDIRGWNMEFGNSFKAQAEVLRLQSELFISQKVAEESVPVSIVDVFSTSLFRLLGELSSINESSSRSGEDIKSFEIVRLVDQIIENCNKSLAGVTNPIQANASKSFNSSSIFTPGTTAMKRPPSVASLTRESTGISYSSSSSSSSSVPLPSSKPLRKASGILGQRGHEIGLPATTNNTNPATNKSHHTTNNRLSLVGYGHNNSTNNNNNTLGGLTSSKYKKRDSMISLSSSPSSTIHNRRSSTAHSHLPTSSSSSSLGSGGNPKSLRRSIVPGSVIPSSVKKHSVIIRSPLRNNRKAVKRVRWEDDEEEEQNNTHSEAEGEGEKEGANVPEADTQMVISTPAKAINFNDNNRITPTRIGLVTPRSSLLVSSSLSLSQRGSGTPSSLPRYKQGMGIGSSNSYGLGSTELTPRRSHLRYGHSSVISPVNRSMLGTVLFNKLPSIENADHDEEMNDNDLQDENLKTHNSNATKEDIGSDGEDISLDSLPAPPQLNSSSSNEFNKPNGNTLRNRRISFEPMDIDGNDSFNGINHLENEQPSKMQPPSIFSNGGLNSSSSLPTGQNPGNKPRFGVKGELRRKSGIPSTPLAGSTKAPEITLGSGAGKISFNIGQGNGTKSSQLSSSSSLLQTSSKPSGSSITVNPVTAASQVPMPPSSFVSRQSLVSNLVGTFENISSGKENARTLPPKATLDQKSQLDSNDANNNSKNNQKDHTDGGENEIPRIGSTKDTNTLSS